MKLASEKTCRDVNTVIQEPMSLYHNYTVLLCSRLQQQDSTCDVCIYNFTSRVKFYGNYVKIFVGFFCGNTFCRLWKNHKDHNNYDLQNLVPHGARYGYI